MSAPPPYTKPEIERRWLVPAESLLGSSPERVRVIDDHYIHGTRLRLRKVTESGQCTVYKLPESVTPEPATAWLVPMASTIAVHRPLGAAALLPRCMGRLS